MPMAGGHEGGRVEGGNEQDLMRVMLGLTANCCPTTMLYLLYLAVAAVHKKSYLIPQPRFFCCAIRIVLSLAAEMGQDSS